MQAVLGRSLTKKTNGFGLGFYRVQGGWSIGRWRIGGGWSSKVWVWCQGLALGLLNGEGAGEGLCLGKGLLAGGWCVRRCLQGLCEGLEAKLCKAA